MCLNEYDELSLLDCPWSTVIPAKHRPNIQPIFRHFFKADLVIRSRVDRRIKQRHLILATTHQLQLLKRAKRWRMHGTLKLVKQPFDQLLSIHVFIKCTESREIKSVPRRQAKDYKKVFKKIIQLIELNEVSGLRFPWDAMLMETIEELVMVLL